MHHTRTSQLTALCGGSVHSGSTAEHPTIITHVVFVHHVVLLGKYGEVYKTHKLYKYKLFGWVMSIAVWVTLGQWLILASSIPSIS